MIDEKQIGALEKKRFFAGLGALILLCVSIPSFFLAGVEGFNSTFVVCFGAAAVCAMLLSLAAMESAQKQLSRYWSSVLEGTVWRTSAGETVTALGADDTGLDVTVRFPDGYITSIRTTDLEIMTTGVPFRRDDILFDGSKFLASKAKRRWRTQDGRVGLVRNYELSQPEEGPMIRRLTLKLNDGTTDAFNLDQLTPV